MNWIKKANRWYESADGRFSITVSAQSNNKYTVLDRHKKDPICPQYNRMETVHSIHQAKNVVVRWIEEEQASAPSLSDLFSIQAKIVDSTSNEATITLYGDGSGNIKHDGATRNFASQETMWLRLTELATHGFMN